MKGDVELDLGWENWGRKCDYSAAGLAKDPTASARAVPGRDRSGLYTNGSLRAAAREELRQPRPQGHVLGPARRQLPDPARRSRLASANKVIVRGGIGYDTAAARTGWLRANLDGAARHDDGRRRVSQLRPGSSTSAAAWSTRERRRTPARVPTGALCNPTATAVRLRRRSAPSVRRQIARDPIRQPDPPARTSRPRTRSTGHVSSRTTCCSCSASRLVLSRLGSRAAPCHNPGMSKAWFDASSGGGSGVVPAVVQRDHPRRRPARERRDRQGDRRVRGRA